MITHVEPLVDACVLSLQSGLNSVIDLINLQHDDFALPHVSDDALKPGGLAKATTVYPFVEVSAAEVLLGEPAIQQVAYNRAETTMVVVAWCRDVDDERLYRSIMRYGQALLQVLSTNNAFGTEARVERARVQYRRDPAASTTEQLVGRVAVWVTVIVDDETP